MVLADCPSDEKAYEWRDQGAFTPAIFAALRGEALARRQPPERILTLQHITDYVEDRLSDLAGGKQHVLIRPCGTTDSSKIPLRVLSIPTSTVVAVPATY